MMPKQRKNNQKKPFTKAIMPEIQLDQFNRQVHISGLQIQDEHLFKLLKQTPKQQWPQLLIDLLDRGLFMYLHAREVSNISKHQGELLIFEVKHSKQNGQEMFL